MPVHVVRGKRGGPVLYVQGGLHGDELIGVEAARRIASRVRPHELKGTLVSVPIANPPALVSRQRGWPAEARGPVDMNRVFPGDPKGPLTARIAHALFDGILRRSDYCLDFHGGLSGSSEAPFAQVVMLDDDHGTLATRRRMADAFGTELIYEMHAQERGRHAVFKGLEHSFAEQARLAGVPTLVVELGEGGRLDDELVSFAVQGILNVMASLEMIQSQPVEPRRRLRFRTVVILRPEHGGTLLLRVRPGESVEKGEQLGEVADGLKVVEKLRAPATGIVQRVATLGTTEPGADILWVAVADGGPRTEVGDGD